MRSIGYSKRETAEIVMSWNKSLSRILTGSVASLVAVTGLYANQHEPCGTKPEACCEEPKPGPFAFAYPQNIDLNCPKDVCMYVTGLAIQAKQDGMAYAISNANGTSLPLTGGKVLGFSHDNHDFDYNPGIRAGLGFLVNHDTWAINFDWTWVNITNYRSYGAENAGVLLPLWTTPIGPALTSWQSASASWSAHYNTLDANIGKPYHISHYFLLKPHFGVRAAWIDQHFSVHYGGTFNAQSNAVHHGDNNFWGFGTRAGVNTVWMIGKGWNLFANMAAALLFGKFDIDQQIGLGSGVANTGFDIDEDFYQNVPNMEMQFGISWNRYFNQQKYRMGFAVAYEFHQWWDQFNMRKFYGSVTSATTYQLQSDTASRGNLSLNGFSLSIYCDI
jgi:hypothetical protein